MITFFPILSYYIEIKYFFNTVYNKIMLRKYYTN